jgi:hypothetical protein
MSTPRLDEAHELLELLRAALADLPDVHATINPAEAVSAARNGCVLIQPPELSFPTWDQTEAAWELLVVAGSMTNYVHAWGVIDAILAALTDAQTLNLDTAEPASFQPPGTTQAQVIPAYKITLNP